MKSRKEEPIGRKQDSTHSAGDSIELHIRTVEGDGTPPDVRAVRRNSSEKGSEHAGANRSGANQFEPQPDGEIGCAANAGVPDRQAERGDPVEIAAESASGRDDLNLRQKLSEVRRRIGYIQKRGHNERFNYTYVTAADLAGAVGDALADLGVVVIPRLESIAYESISPNHTVPQSITRVVMSYTFMDVNSAEQITVKVPGEGRDPGDKGPYKAMTGALKYALLQSFLIATGDDPEDERADDGDRPVGKTGGATGSAISLEQTSHLQEMIDYTGTDLTKVLEYFKVTKLEELTTDAYERAVKVLKRKPPLVAGAENAHA
jgi:ERF superfamily